MTTGPTIPARQPSPTSVPGTRKWIAFGVASLGMLISTLDGTIVLFSFPALATTFQADASIVSWVGIAYLLTSTSLLLTMGWVADFLGRERTYLLGILVFTVPLVFESLAQNIFQIIAWRAVQGIGSAMILATAAAIIAAAFPQRERGFAFGLTGAVVGIGLGSGPPLGGVLLDFLDWRALFYARVPLGLVAMVLVWVFLVRGSRTSNSQTRGPLHLDAPGSALLLLMLGSFLFAVSQAGRLGLTSLLVVGGAIASLVFLPLFVLRERRARRPIVELGLFANPIYARGVLALLAHFQAWNAVGFLLPFAMIDGLGYSATKAGSILAVFSLVRSIASPVAGWLADRIDYRIPMGLGMGLMAGSLILLSRLTLDVAQWQLIAVLAVASVGSALFDPSNSASMMGTVPPARLGLAGATIATARQIGLSIGIALAGAVLAARKAHHLTVLAPTGEATSGAAANALMAGTGDALLVSAVICALGILPIVFWGGRSIPAAASPSDPQRE